MVPADLLPSAVADGSGAPVVAAPAAGDAPRRPSVVIEPTRGVLSIDLRGLWQHRELLYFLVWRDVKVRYKQTAIGAAWAVVQPLALVLVFTVVFSYLVSVPSDGLPYPLFAYVALLPWTCVSQAVMRGGGSLVGHAHLIGKVYFPRLLIPVSATLTPVVDLLISLLVLAGLMAWYGVVPDARVALVLLFTAYAVFTAVAISLWLSALNARYRDVGHVTPFLVQFWMYASPIVYPASVIPERWRFLYGLNPMATIVDGFRWSLLGQRTLPLEAMAASAVAVLAVFAGGVVYFRRTERTLADVV
jgi:lipopolysaccharide transport system permease protein